MLINGNYPGILITILIVTLLHIHVIHGSAYYQYRIENEWIRVSDGVRLSATITSPIQKQPDEAFPVLLQYKPYRKDDNMFYADQNNVRYLVRRGFIVAQIDIRGTGSSEGILVDREYSETELNDCYTAIEYLAKYGHSNGRVGMFGISWSAFNTLMMATLRRPPALRAIYAAHGSEDLYKNDVHYPDGIMHVSDFMIFIDHMNSVPSSLTYDLDEKWLNERFRRRPWIDVQLSNQIDDKFWRKHSVKYALDNFTVPAYLVGGLYDPYRDFAINIYQGAHKRSPKIRTVIGPFGHAFPEQLERHAGPGYDGKADMIRWFNYWLRDNYNDTSIMSEPDFVLFIRTSLTTGFYRYETEWPIRRQRQHRMYMSVNNRMVEAKPVSSRKDTNVLDYHPCIGFEVMSAMDGFPIDQKPFDDDSLIYDSEPIASSMELVGFVNVSLQVSTDASLAHWIVRLEDIDLAGNASLITFGALNGAQIEETPQLLIPEKLYTIKIRLHFTTWTFLPGHRVRVALSNAMFPSFWPSPFPMRTKVFLDPNYTFIDLPILLKSEAPVHLETPAFTEKQVLADDQIPRNFAGARPTTFTKTTSNGTTLIQFERALYSIYPNNNNNFMSTWITGNITCSHSHPSDVQWSARAIQRFVSNVHGYPSIRDVPMLNTKNGVIPDIELSSRRHFQLTTETLVKSDLNAFYVKFNRRVTSKNLTETFNFENTHKRQYQ